MPGQNQNQQQPNLLDRFVSGVVQPVTNFVGNSPVFNTLFGTAKNIATDVGTAIGQQQVPGLQASQQNAIDMAQKASAKADQIQATNPEEAARLRKVAGQTFQTVGQGAQQQAAAFSPDVNKSPIARGAQAGMEIGTGADLLAHPIQTIQGVGKMAGALLHPIQTARTIADVAANFPEYATSFIKQALADPNNFRLTQGDNAFTNLANRVLAGQYKGAGKVVSAPADVAGTLAKEYNLYTPEQVGKAADIVTGKTGVAPARMGRALLQTDAVDTTGITGNPLRQDILSKSLDSATALPDANKKAITKFVQNAIGDINSAPAGDQATKTFKFVQDLDSQISDYSGSQSVADQQAARVLSGVKNAVATRLYTGADATGQVTRVGLDKALESVPFTPEELKLLDGVSPELGAAARNVQGGAQLRSFQAPFVQGSQMVGAANRATQTGLNLPETMGTAVTAMGHPEVGIPMTLASTQGGKAAIGKTLMDVGQAVGGGGANLTPLSLLGQTLIRPTGGPQDAGQYGNQGQQVISPPGTSIAGGATRYQTPTLPQGFINPNDAANQLSSLQQKMGSEQLTDPIQYAQDQGTYNALQTQIETQKPVTTQWQKLGLVNSGAQLLTNAISSADPSLFNSVDWLNKLATQQGGKYATLATQIQNFAKLSGIDLSKQRGAQALISAVDGASQAELANYNTLVQQYSGGVSPTVTNQGVISPQTQGTPATISPQPDGVIPSNFSFGRAGAGMPVSPIPNQ